MLSNRTIIKKNGAIVGKVIALIAINYFLWISLFHIFDDNTLERLYGKVGAIADIIRLFVWSFSSFLLNRKFRILIRE